MKESIGNENQAKPTPAKRGRPRRYDKPMMSVACRVPVAVARAAADEAGGKSIGHVIHDALKAGRPDWPWPEKEGGPAAGPDGG